MYASCVLILDLFIVCNIIHSIDMFIVAKPSIFFLSRSCLLSRSFISLVLIRFSTSTSGFSSPNAIRQQPAARSCRFKCSLNGDLLPLNFSPGRYIILTQKKSIAILLYCVFNNLKKKSLSVVFLDSTLITHDNFTRFKSQTFSTKLTFESIKVAVNKI